MPSTIDQILNIGIPLLLIGLVIGWIWKQFGDSLKDAFAWIKSQFSDKKKSKIEEFQYIEYD
jgi:hypothetical protein